MNISFRLMTIKELPLVSYWQSAPEVRQWYGKEHETREKFEKYLRNKLEKVPCYTHHYIIQLDGVDAGFIQTYLLYLYPDYNQLVQADDRTAGIDIFLAQDFMHKGYGSSIMKTFLNDYVFSGCLFFADKCIIGPEPKNLYAIRMYEKAGFRYLKTIQIPDEDEPEYIMIIYKDVQIKLLAKTHLPLYADVIRRSFATVAQDFGWTRENAPTFAAFVTNEKLDEKIKDGYYTFGLCDGEKIFSFASLTDLGGGTYELNKLAVLPEWRHYGYGKKLLDFCKAKVSELGGSKISLDIIEENTLLKNWYAANGFVHTGIEKPMDRPFTRGFMEWTSI